ncbi:hypothetical protein IDH44_18380 [Paenibacillus sp. IB182496]|uniref:LiaF transmembrane domain-containing protein n=1 Tax=Paenibacillus sabuli TaxID=2772509 RepID=A0A927GTB6_9BACL|nr:hypothetical protein [Paenibacillus sabuli]MBD2847171.1 hypothetical protein [Paenibacillus sabuli]
MNGKTIMKTVLVIAGVYLVLKLLGITLGAVMSFLFPVLLIGIGWIGLKNKHSLIGVSLIVIGALLLIGKLSGLLVILGIVGLIVWGVSLLLSGKRRAT